MLGPAKTLVIPLFGVLVLSASAIAQSVDQKDTAGATASLSAPVAESEQPAVAPNLGQGTKAQAEHSAEATAHKSLNDPNNQLGTSLQGRTRPVVEASQNTPAPAATPAETTPQ